MAANRLINEKSPYLLQHARNPVDWYPWSGEAFDRARRENKLIFLSVGYATCHWCHVMEKESFESEVAARHLNDTFISIKVDREERPDIDAVYMAACQLLHGSGGWPLTVVMTPDKRPFFAGTYLPRESRFGRMGVIDLCRQVNALWEKDPERITASAAGITGRLEAAFTYASGDPPGGGDLDRSVIDQAVGQIATSYDSQFGGFESAPKFPMPHRLLLLLRQYQRGGDPKLLEMVTRTLTAMRLGGIWDHVGFGFHRYATDARWRLPHFEKMLYDQALLAMAYLKAFQVTRDVFLSRTAEEIFTYVLGKMTASQGAFFSAEDADSEGEEGKFYVWRVDDFRRVLERDEADFWQKTFNLRLKGNFAEEAGGKTTGANVLYLDRTAAQRAEASGDDGPVSDERWEKVRRKLYIARERRIHPLRDDKILTDWNGLMIAALSLGAEVLEKPAYARAARRAADFVMTRMCDDRGRLRHRFRDGETAGPAFADDYAFMIWGVLNLYRATGDPLLLERAAALQHRMIQDYSDRQGGGFFMTQKDPKDLPVRPKTLYDGAIPSANSVSLFNLARLFRLTGDATWHRMAAKLTRSFADVVRNHPAAHTFFLFGTDYLWDAGIQNDGG